VPSKLIYLPSPSKAMRKSLVSTLYVGLPAAALLVYCGLHLAEADFIRTLLCVGIFAALWILTQISPRTSLTAIFIYLAFLGGIRRGLIPSLGWPNQDPLLLVGPAIAALFCLILLASRRIRITTTLSRLILLMLGLMICEIVNPLQGGIAIGLAGALFYVTPLLWFFVGRLICDEAALTRLYKATIIVAVVGALYGLYQTFFGFSETDKEWMEMSGQIALFVGDSIRAISFFTSAAEYVWVVCIAIVILWAMFLSGKKTALIPVPLLMTAVFLESGRGPVIATLATLTVMWAIQARNKRMWISRGIVAVAVVGVCLTTGMQQLQGLQLSSNVSSLVTHQITGMLDPSDPQSSTAVLHTVMMIQGIASGFQHPLGEGLGATTLAAGKLGGAGGSTEVDISNIFQSLGFVGGSIYLVIISAVLTLALRNWSANRSFTSLAIIGVLLIGLGQWLNGAQYSVAFLSWTSIGALDRMVRRGSLDRLIAPTYATEMALPEPEPVLNYEVP
jgi:hypothetical protein